MESSKTGKFFNYEQFGIEKHLRGITFNSLYEHIHAGNFVEQFRGTTILSIRKGNRVVIGGDGQVSMGDTIMKGNARKVRRLYKDKVIAGFAGGTADAFTLFERFEGKLDKYQGNLTRRGLRIRPTGPYRDQSVFRFNYIAIA